MTASNSGQNVNFARYCASSVSSGDSTGSLSSTAAMSFIFTEESSGSAAVSKIIPCRFCAPAPNETSTRQPDLARRSSSFGTE